MSRTALMSHISSPMRLLQPSILFFRGQRTCVGDATAPSTISAHTMTDTCEAPSEESEGSRRRKRGRERRGGVMRSDEDRRRAKREAEGGGRTPGLQRRRTRTGASSRHQHRRWQPPISEQLAAWPGVGARMPMSVLVCEVCCVCWSDGAVARMIGGVREASCVAEREGEREVGGRERRGERRGDQALGGSRSSRRAAS